MLTVNFFYNVPSAYVSCINTCATKRNWTLGLGPETCTVVSWDIWDIKKKTNEKDKDLSVL